MLSVVLRAVTAEINEMWTFIYLKKFILSGLQEIMKIISEVMLKQKQCDDPNNDFFFTNIISLL